MLESLHLTHRASQTGDNPGLKSTQDRVEELLARPFIRVENRGLELVVPESRFLELAREYGFPDYLMQKLASSRLLAFAQGKDRLNAGRVAVLYYTLDDMLVVTHVQDGIPATKLLGRETADDSPILEQFYTAGFLPILPAGAYPKHEEL